MTHEKVLIPHKKLLIPHEKVLKRHEYIIIVMRRRKHFFGLSACG